MKTFSSHVFGCRVNQAEMEIIEREMIEKGFRYNKDNPDIFIVNSCAVTHKAERRVRQFLNRLRREKPKTKIVLTGCSATYWLQRNLNNIDADLVVDNSNKNHLISLIEKRFFKKKVLEKITAFDNQTKNKYLSSGRVMIKIQDGCHRFCTYCIVPYLRGLPHSKTIKEIIDEINFYPYLAEVILTAINTEAFGRDTGENLIDLIKSVLRKTKVGRVSFGSIHPWSISDKFINFYQKSLQTDRFVHFFHIPLQSGSNKILRLMKRNYSRQEWKEKLQALHKINPQALLATDIIVGFLTETKKDFYDTYQFLKESPLVKFHVFRFSKRKGTAAYYLSKHLNEPSEKEKKERSQALISLSNKKLTHFKETQVGRIAPALFLNKRKANFQLALFDNQLEILVKTDKNFAGQIKPIKITRFKDGKLIGQLR